MGLSYAVTTGAVLLGMAAVFFAVLRIPRLRVTAPIVGSAGLVYAVARAIGAAFNTAYEAGFRHANGSVPTEDVLAPILMALGLVVASIVAVSLLRAVRLPSLLPPVPSSDDPLNAETDDAAPIVPTGPAGREAAVARSRTWVPWLGLIGLAAVVLGHAPSPVRHADFGGGNGRVLVASYAFEAFVIGLAAIVVLDRVADIGVIALAAFGVVVPAVGLLFSLADSDALRGLFAGIGVALLLPAALDVIATTVRGSSVAELFGPVALGVVVLVVAALAQGLLAKYQIQQVDFGREGRTPLPIAPAPRCVVSSPTAGPGAAFACPGGAPTIPRLVPRCPSPSPLSGGLTLCRASAVPIP